MCRFGGKNYKNTYACFNCRKVFKKTAIYDYMKQHGLLEIYINLSNAYYKKSLLNLLELTYNTKYDDLINNYKNQINKCPQCGNIMADLGKTFKAPKKTNIKEWHIIEGMYKIGHVFLSCGCDGIGFVPTDLKEYDEYLNDKLHKYESELKECVSTSTVSDYNDDINFWKEKIENINAELRKIK
jgi:hypothetical protein